MTHFALDEDYFLLQNQPPTPGKISAFAPVQGTRRPQNALHHASLRKSSPHQNLGQPSPGNGFRGFPTGTSYRIGRPERPLSGKSSVCSWPVVRTQHSARKPSFAQKENNQTPLNNEGACHGIHSM